MRYAHDRIRIAYASRSIASVLPFIAIMLALLIVVTYVPALSLWLPNLVFAK